MRKFVGFFVFLTGLAFAVFAYYPDVFDRETMLAEVTEIVAAPAGDVSRRVPETTDPIRTFSPNRVLTIEKPKASPLPARETVVAQSNPVITKAAPPPPAVDPPTNGWQTIVRPESGLVPTGVTSSKPGDEHARYELVVNIQRELKRAGCLGGTPSGSWNANTKRAMGAFVERVNATLPIDEPDYILLTLIKGHAAASCGACPSGQVMSDGRCMPNAIIAQRNAPRPDGRKVEAAARPSGLKFTTTTAVAAADATSTAVTSSIAALPGRMSIGGPIAAPPLVQMMPPKTKTVALLEDDNQSALPPSDGEPAYQAPNAAPSANPAAAPAPQSVYVVPAPSSRVRAAPRPQRDSGRRSGTRSVQNLFTHPLGRM